MARRGRADGSRLLGWDRVRAQDRARQTGRPTRFGIEITPWLRAQHAILVPPNAEHPWIVRTAAGVELGRGSTPRRAVNHARRQLRTTDAP